MATDLSDLMRELTADPPAERTAVHDIVRRGRVRQRVRSGLIISAAAAATAGVVVVAGLLSDATQAPRPAPPTGPGVVLHLTDAETARPGDDIVLLSTQMNDIERGLGGEYVAGTTEDDKLLLLDEVAVGDSDYAVRVGLMDPGSDEKEWLPETDLVVSQPLELSEERLVFLVEVETRGPELGIFDRASGTWSSITWPGLAKLPKGFGEAHVGPDGRLYIGMEPVDRSASGLRYDLWSASLTDPTDLRDERTPVADFDITGDTLTWASGEPLQPSALHERDLDTGTQRTLEATVPANCPVADLVRSDGVIAIAERCGNSPGQVQVVADDGRTLATITGLEGGSLDFGLDVAGDWVLISSVPRDDHGVSCTHPSSGPFGPGVKPGEAPRDLTRAYLHAESCAEMEEVYREFVGDPGDAFQEIPPEPGPTSAAGYFAFDTASGDLFRLNERASDLPTVRLTSNDWILYDEPVEGGSGRRQHVAQLPD